MATVDRNNEVYMRELRYRAEQCIDEVVIHHVKNGGKFDAKQATGLLMTCIEYARLATDMLAANGLLPPEQEPKLQLTRVSEKTEKTEKKKTGKKKKEEVTSEVSDLG